MNNGAFGENFPYSNFHDLNMDWIVKIAKDFLDQYTHIQQIIEDGETSITNLTTEELQQLQEKAKELKTLLQEWYDDHSHDISNELSAALANIQTKLNTSIDTFNTVATEKGIEVINSIPDDYTELANSVAALINLAYMLPSTFYATVKGKYIDYEKMAEKSHVDYNCTPYILVPNRISTDFVQHSGACLCFYDGNKNAISATKDYSNISIPSNAVYFRISDYAQGISNNRSVICYYDYPISKLPELVLRNRANIIDNKLTESHIATIDNTYIDKNTGNAESIDNYKASDFIPIAPGARIVRENYIMSSGAVALAFYNINKTFISSTSEMPAIAPANSKYVRFSAEKDHGNMGIKILYNLFPLYGNTATFFCNTMSGYLDFNTGKYYDHASYMVSDYIPCPDKITTNCVQGGSDACIVFYDGNLNPIFRTKDYSNIYVPNSAKYFRVSNYLGSNNENINKKITCYYYGNRDTVQNNPLYNKKISFMGDSLTSGEYKYPWETYVNLIGINNHATVVNLGISGSSVADAGSDRNPMVNRLDTIPTDSDLIFIMGGANDYNAEVPIGTPTDSSTSTFYGAINHIINYLNTNIPSAKILFATTWRRTSNKDDEAYAEAMIDCCKRGNIPCLDMYHESNIHMFNSAWMEIFGAWTWTGDESTKMTNRHLNALGDKFISTQIEAKLKSI